MSRLMVLPLGPGRDLSSWIEATECNPISTILLDRRPNLYLYLLADGCGQVIVLEKAEALNPLIWPLIPASQVHVVLGGYLKD